MYSPARHLRRIGRAERDALEIRAGTKKVQQVGKSLLLLEQTAEVVDDRAEPQLNMPALLAGASQARDAQAVLDEVNVAKSILHAESLLKSEQSQPSEKAINDDWLRNWRDGAARVSSDELQSLWGRILAGEVKAPGSCSLRTLDFIKNLSQEEARAIEAICPYIVDKSFIFKCGVLANQEGPISFEYLMFLEELGLINLGGGLGLNVKMPTLMGDRFIRPLLTTNRALVVTAPDATKTLVLENYRVTPLGVQVFSLNPVAADEAYLNAVCASCIQQGFEVKIGDYRHVGNGQIQVFNDISIQGPKQ